MLAALLFSAELVAVLYVDVIKAVDKTGQTPTITVIPSTNSFLTYCLTRIGGQGYDHPELQFPPLLD
jgi:hypothetical protein